MAQGSPARVLGRNLPSLAVVEHTGWKQIAPGGRRRASRPLYARPGVSVGAPGVVAVTPTGPVLSSPTPGIVSA